MPPKPKESAVCCECYTTIGTIQSRCRHDDKTHLFCKMCADKSFKRSERNPWYSQYTLWCDSCIWFDIG